jgi:RNA polymerase sigma factor (TIGR02999 family)
MSEVTRILAAVDAGDPGAVEQLLPLVYSELRKLAAQKLAHEKPGQTLQATALVHEAYLRLVGDQSPPVATGGLFANTGHFFAAAAEAMRRILIEQARRKQRVKHGGQMQRVDLDAAAVMVAEPPDDLLAVDEALRRLEALDSSAAALVKLRYFAGMSMPDAAAALGMSQRTAERNWTYARAWLRRELHSQE